MARRRRRGTWDRGEAERLRALVRENPGRYWRAVTVMAMLRLGWQPPVPDDAIADRILSDMYPSGSWQEQVAHLIDGQGRSRREQGREREHRPHVNASLDLSPAEAETLAMLASGMTQPEIAEEVQRSQETIKTRVASIRSRLGARSTSQAVAIAVRRGII